MNEKTKKAYFLSKSKLGSKITQNKKSSPIKSFNGIKSKASPPSASKKIIKNPQSSLQYKKTFINSMKSPPKQSLFPKLNANQTEKSENESKDLDFLPPINIKTQLPSPTNDLEDGEVAIFQLPDDDDDYSMPSGLVIQQPNETQEKIEKIDPFKPITMDESSAFYETNQYPDSIPPSCLGTPLQSPNSLYNSDNYFNQYGIPEEEEEEYLPPPTPKYGSIMVQAGENPSITLTLPLDKIKPDIPEDGSLPNLPPRLAAIVGRNKTSVSYLALCGVPVNGYQPKLIRNALKELEKYEEVCIAYGFTAEARFVNDTINLVKADLKDRLSTNDISEIYEIEDKISKIDTEIDQKEAAYKNSIARLNAEKDIELKNIEIECDCDCDEIDREWTSPEKAQHFCRGSKRLHDMRVEASTLLASKKFDEASELSKRADKLAEKEAEIVHQAMKMKYAKALKKRRDKFVQDCKTIEDSYEQKFILMEKKKTKMLDILYKRKGKLENKKTSLENKNAVKERNVQQKSAINDSPPRLRKAKDVTLKSNYALPLHPLSKLSRTTTLKFRNGII